MCKAKKDGGARCFSHETFGKSPNEIKARIKALKAKKQQNGEIKPEEADQLKTLLRDYATTEEGIEQLEEDGKQEQADKFRSRRNRLIEAYNNEYGKNKPLFPEKKERDEQREYTRHPRIWNKDGFNVQQRQKRIHRDTGTVWNPEGWNHLGNHRETGTRFHPTTGLTADGYDQQGFHAETGLDRQGFDSTGYNGSGWHKEGHTKPDGNGRMFDRKGEPYPASDDAPDVWGWSFSTATNDFMHEATGTNRDPQGNDYFEAKAQTDTSPSAWYGWWK